MRLPSRVILFALCIISSVACYADFSRLFTPGGEGTLPEKLVVTDSNAMLYKDFSSVPTKIEPLTILWRLTDKKAKDPKDPVVSNDGKNYYCVGGPDGKEWGYVETSKVTPWMTRFVFAPLPPTDECAFKVLNKSFSKKDYSDASDSKIDGVTVAQISEVPPGFSSFAFILNESSGQATNKKDQGITIDPNDFKSVMIYNTPITDGATGGKAAVSKVKGNDVGLDIVFVIDTTGSMQPMINEAIEVCKAIAKQVKDASEVHFGLVEYRDSESSDDDFGAKVVCNLSESYDAFLAKLNALQAAGGGDEPEDVMLGLKYAVDSAKWHDNTSKHIILIGDAPNKATKEAGTITNFKQLYGYTNGGLVGDVQSQAFQRILFHAIVGGSNPVTELEFNEVAQNNGEMNGYFGNMTKNPNVASELTKILSEGIDATESDSESSTSANSVVARSVWNLKKIVENGQQGAKASDTNKVEGYACARTNKDEKCASLNILVLRDEMEDFEDSLTQVHRRLDKLNTVGAGNVKVIFDAFLEEYVGVTSGTATDDDYAKNLEEILGLQMPVKTKTLKMSFRDVMRMDVKARAKWMDDIKDARDRVKTILNQKERWVETYNGTGDRGQKFAFIPIEDLP